MGHGQGRSDWHAHHAHQIAVSLDGTCMFRSQVDEDWAPFAGAIISSQRKHQFEFKGTIAHLFVEPETSSGRALDRYIAETGISPLPKAECSRMAATLLASERLGQTGDARVAVAKAALAVLTGAPSPSLHVDRRVIKAIEDICLRIRAPISLADAASVVALSPGRFRHLFVQETGTPFRHYLLWLRLNVAIEAAMTGASWTAAAHEAGFSDSAHFTRTFKRMFGINPAALSAARVAASHPE